MKLVNQIELVLENFEKCAIVCDSDCPLGQIYDYTTAVQSYVLQRMKELEAKQLEEKQKSADPPKE